MIKKFFYDTLIQKLMRTRIMPQLANEAAELCLGRLEADGELLRLTSKLPGTEEHQQSNVLLPREPCKDHSAERVQTVSNLRSYSG